MKLKKWIALTATLSTTLCFAADDSGVNIKWSYEGDTGPKNWGYLAKEFAVCSTGKEQSPVNVVNATPLQKQSLMINYQTDPFTIVEDGETELNIHHSKTVIRDGHSVQLNVGKTAKPELMTYQGKSYHLVQFHFHTPSENKLFGKSYPMEIHFVNQNDEGNVAVLGVLVSVGDANPTLQKIVDQLPKTIHQEDPLKDPINPTDLLPKELSHYAFNGSLTTPPCTEGLQWILFNHAITASKEQIQALIAATDGSNARPVQALFDRKIQYVDK